MTPESNNLREAVRIQQPPSTRAHTEKKLVVLRAHIVRICTNVRTFSVRKIIVRTCIVPNIRCPDIQYDSRSPVIQRYLTKLSEDAMQPLPGVGRRVLFRGEGP